MYFPLIKYFTFCVEISTLRPIFRQEAVQNLNGNVEISTIRFFELFNEFPRTFSVVIFKYRIDLVITFKELILAFLKVLGQCTVDGFQTDNLINGRRDQYCLAAALKRGMLPDLFILLLFLFFLWTITI